MSQENGAIVTEIGKIEGGQRVTMEVDKCQLAMSQLKAAEIPLYDVEALQQSEKDLRAQANGLRRQAGELDQQAAEHGAMSLMCIRRDRELAAKGMLLENGRIRLADGDNI